MENIKSKLIVIFLIPIMVINHQPAVFRQPPAIAVTKETNGKK